MTLTLTFTIGWLKHLGGAGLRYAKLSFNFHHRVVETDLRIGKLLPVQTLTFTIGWLKLLYEEIKFAQYGALTFTIGWLKHTQAGINHEQYRL